LHSAEQSEWILGVDADTQPSPGLVASLRDGASWGYDLVSLSPQFILKYPGVGYNRRFDHLLYRFDPAGCKYSGV